MYKKLIIFLTLIVFSFLSKSQCKDSIFVPFTNTTPTQGGTWATNSIAFGDSLRCGGTSNSCALSKPNYVEFNGIGDWIRTPLITQNATFSFWYRRSTNNTGHRVIVETSPNNSVWTTQLEITTIGTTFRQATINVNNVFVRIRDQRDSTTSTRLWYLDDVKWTWDKAGTIWNGSVSSDWQNPANWCKGVLPTSTDSVIIPGGTLNNPVLSSGVGLCKDLVINSTGQLTIQNATLQVYGNITSSTKISSLNGTVELAGSSSQNISGSHFTNKVLGSLIVSNFNGVNIISDTLKIKKELLFGAYTCTLNTNGFLYLLSSDSVTARIGDMTSCRILGDVTVERFIPNHPAKWQFLSVPTFGQTINQSWQEGNTPTGNLRPGYGTSITSNQSNATSIGFDGVSAGGPSMKSYNDVVGNYVGVSNTNLPIQTNTGYMLFVRGDRSVLNSTQPATSTILRTKGTIYSPIDNPPPTINVIADSFQSVNNFYASSIDFNSITRTGGVQNVFYLWDPSLNGLFGVGGFQTFIWNGSSYSVTPGGGNYVNGNNKIESGSAFFVRAEGTSGTVRLTESCKSSGSNLVLRQNNSEVKSVSINLLSNTTQTNLIDGVISIFGDEYSNEVDINDAFKLQFIQGMAINKSAKKLAGELKQQLNLDTTQLFIKNLTVGSYKIEIESNNMEPNDKLLIYDNFLKTKKRIIPNSKTTIEFEITSSPISKDSLRFYYVLENKKIELSKEEEIVDESLGEIIVYPNPYDKGILTAEFKEIEDGNYLLWIINLSSGVRVHKQNIFHQKNSPVHNLNFQKPLPTSQYLIVVEGKDNQLYTTQLSVN